VSDDIHALSGAYAVDAVDDVERVRFERHLAGCEACQTEVASLQAAAAELSALSELAPPPALKAKVMADIRTVRPLPPVVRTDAPASGTASGTASAPADEVTPTAQTPTSPAAGDDDERVTPMPSAPSAPRAPRGRRRTLWRGLVAAATALVLAVAGFTVWRTANTDPNQTIADQVLAAADATTVTHNLPGGAQAKVVRSASLHKAVLVTKDMPAAPNGKVYQLWLEDPTGHMASAGLMPPGTDQVVVLDGDASKATGAGITVEPAGGSGQPTSAPVVLFSFA
jgi:anti-sigma-K factor RskA